MTKVMEHLNNEEHYKKLQEDPTGLMSQQIESYLFEMKGPHFIDKATFFSLLLQNIRTSRFYIFPMVRKPGVPGRPVHTRSFLGKNVGGKLGLPKI